MSQPDRPVDDCQSAPTRLDPAVVVEVALTEARYLQMQVAAMAAPSPPQPLLDLSPLGR